MIDPGGRWGRWGGGARAAAGGEENLVSLRLRGKLLTSCYLILELLTADTTVTHIVAYTSSNMVNENVVLQKNYLVTRPCTPLRTGALRLRQIAA